VQKYSLHLDVQATLDILRMDLNGQEWQVLAKMAEGGELNHVRQLVLSLSSPDYAPDAAVYVTQLTVLKALFDAGFLIFRSILRESAPPAEKAVYFVVRTVTYEVGLVNTRLPPRSGLGKVSSIHCT
jgi:hypothetical protein